MIDRVHYCAACRRHGCVREAQAEVERLRKQRAVFVTKLASILRLTYHEDMPGHLADLIRPLCVHPADHPDVRAEVERLREELNEAEAMRDHNAKVADARGAEVERLRVFEAAFAKVPQEQQARIMAAVRAEMTETPSSDITAQREA